MSSPSNPITGRKAAYVARNRLILLKATQRVLAEHGPGATVEMVADQAEIAVSTIYKHFSNKEVLFEAAMLSAMKEWEEWALETLKTVSDPFELLVFPMRLQAKLRNTHPLFAQLLARNIPEFIKAVPLANLAIGQAAMELQKANLISVENFDERVSNFIKVGTLTVIELCSDLEMTEEKALLRFSIAAEMLGLPSEKIADLMSRPLPEFA